MTAEFEKARNTARAKILKLLLEIESHIGAEALAHMLAGLAAASCLNLYGVAYTTKLLQDLVAAGDSRHPEEPKH